MIFEWDKSKEVKNVKKHGISFNVASNVFKDSARLEFYDETHSVYEDRYITIGKVADLLIIVVVYTDRSGRIRIISARKANDREKEAYFNEKDTNWYSGID